MHPILRIVILVQLLAAALYGYMAAAQIEEVFPDGAQGDIAITSAHGSDTPVEDLSRAVKEGRVAAGKVTYAETSGVTLRTIEVLRGSPDAPSPGWFPQGEFPTFGLNQATDLRWFDAEGHGEDVVGRWIIDGTAEQLSQMAERLQSSGFELEVRHNGLAERADAFRQTTPLVIQVGGLGMIFAAALLSASRSTRVRTVGEIHGAHPAVPVAVEAFRYVRFAGIAALSTAVVWTAAAVVGWGTGQLWAQPGLMVLVVIGVTAVLAALVSAAAVVVVATVVRRPLERIRGVRPYRTLQTAAAAVCCVVLVGTVIAVGNAQQATTRLDSGRAALSVWEHEPDIQALTLYGASEDVVVDHYGEWERFVAAAADRGELLINELESPCQIGDGTQSCLYVNAEYLRRAEVKRADGQRVLPEALDGKAVTVLHPGATGDAGAVEQQAEERAEFQAHMREILGACESGQEGTGQGEPCPEHTEIPAVNSLPLASGQSMPVYSGNPGLTIDESSLVDPLLVVLPSTGPVPSGDFHLAAASSGNELFLTSRQTLEERVDDFGIGALVMGIEAPRDAARSEITRSALVVTQNVSTVITGIIGAAALVVAGAAIYCERNRRPLFVAFLHGDGFWRRYAPFMAQFLVIAVASYVVAVYGWNAAITVDRVLPVAALLVGLGVIAGPALLSNDRRLRADYIKRP